MGNVFLSCFFFNLLQWNKAKKIKKGHHSTHIIPQFSTYPSSSVLYFTNLAGDIFADLSELLRPFQFIRFQPATM